jgi:hypothetical protein
MKLLMKIILKKGVMEMMIVTGLIIALIVVASLSPALAGSTVQRDAPTTRFYTPDGKSAGTASTYGNTTKFYAPDGKLVGSATRQGGR